MTVFEKVFIVLNFIIMLATFLLDIANAVADRKKK